jgi:hypothetical protein
VRSAPPTPAGADGNWPVGSIIGRMEDTGLVDLGCMSGPIEAMNPLGGVTGMGGPTELVGMDLEPTIPPGVVSMVMSICDPIDDGARPIDGIACGGSVPIGIVPGGVINVGAVGGGPTVSGSGPDPGICIDVVNGCGAPDPSITVSNCCEAPGGGGAALEAVSHGSWNCSEVDME